MPAVYLARLRKYLLFEKVSSSYAKIYLAQYTRDPK